MDGELRVDMRDGEGRGVGNLVGLVALERKWKTGRPKSSRDKPPYDYRCVRSKKAKRTAKVSILGDCSASKCTHFCSIFRQPAYKNATCSDGGDLPLKPRKEAKCTNCGVGGHRKNTSNKRKVILHTVQMVILMVYA